MTDFCRACRDVLLSCHFLIMVGIIVGFAVLPVSVPHWNFIASFVAGVLMGLTCHGILMRMIDIRKGGDYEE